MPFASDTVIAERYRLVECLGAGGMGEVWKAQDSKFSREVHVAIKFLKEDETFAEDARNRSTLARQLAKASAAGHLTFDFVVNLLVEAFNCDLQRDDLAAAAELRLAGDTLGPTQVLDLFDHLVNDSAFNDNAKHRKRLRDMFATEANSVAVLQHPNLVRVTDYGEHEASPFLVMDYIDGVPLQQVIQRRQPLPVGRRLRLIEDLCEGLAYAHGKELVHRDIKPANLIIDSESDRLKILDFGIARQQQVGQRTASIGLPIGTFCYMSPEQTRASRSLDHRSDIFSVGLVFYELLSYQRAFPSAGDVGELISRIQRDPPPPLRDLVPDLDPEIEAIVYKAIEKVPARRFQTLTEMRQAIEPIAQRIEEEERRRRQRLGADTIIARPKSLAMQLSDLNDTATTAFVAGNDTAVLAYCEEMLSLAPGEPEVLALKDQAAARKARKALDAIIKEARRLLEEGDHTAAGQLLERPEIDTRNQQVLDFIADLEDGRRAKRVESLIQDARMYLATGAPDTALERAQAALELDANNRDAQRMIERARAQQRALRQQQVDAALAQAELAVAEGRLPDAIRALSEFTGEPAADAMLAALRPKHDEQVARERTVRESTARARALIDTGEFKRAFDLVSQTSALDRRNEQLIDLRRWLEPIVGAIEQLGEVVSLFDQDQDDEAEQRLGGAASQIEPYVAAHPSLQAHLDEVAAARTAAVERKDAEKRRAAAAAEERRRRALRDAEEEQERAVADIAARVREALAASAFELAERDLALLAEFHHSQTLAAELNTELAVARQRARDAAAARQVELAIQLADRGDLEDAAALLRAFASPHPTIDTALEKVERAISNRESERARAAEADRLRRDIERRIDEALAAADARFAAGERDAAVELLRAFQPRHPRIEAHHAALQKEQARLNAVEKVDIERARIETDRARAEAERREWLDRADAAAGDQDYGTALALLRERLATDPSDAEVSNQFQRTLDDLRTAVVREPANQRFRDTLRQYEPPPSRTNRRLVASVAIAATLLAVAGGVWLFRGQTAPPVAEQKPVAETPTTGGVPTPAANAQPLSTQTTPQPPAPTPIPQPPPEIATLIVNLRPWARVQIRPAQADATNKPEPQLTPFTINLPAGEYILEAENGGLTSPLRLPIRLAGGQVTPLARDMPGFNAERVLDTLLGPVR